MLQNQYPESCLKIHGSLYFNHLLSVIAEADFSSPYIQRHFMQECSLAISST